MLNAYKRKFMYDIRLEKQSYLKSTQNYVRSILNSTQNYVRTTIKLTQNLRLTTQNSASSMHERSLYINSTHSPPILHNFAAF